MNCKAMNWDEAVEYLKEHDDNRCIDDDAEQLFLYRWDDGVKAIDLQDSSDDWGPVNAYNVRHCEFLAVPSEFFDHPAEDE